MGRRIGGQRGETDDEERKGKASIKTTAQTERGRERVWHCATLQQQLTDSHSLTTD